VEIEATYLVQPNSPIKTIDDVDRVGVRIAISGKSAYDLYLTRNLKHAQLVRETGADNVFKRFVEDKLDAIAGLKPRLITDQQNLAGSRILDGRFTAVQQAIGTPKGRPEGARYLREFAEEVKKSGLVAQLIEKNSVRGLTVAALAS
jgi:polar amino acid transport system substrate-binding protein